MINQEQYMNIKELSQEGHSIKAISRITGHSRNTVRKVLRGQHTLRMKRVKRASKLDPFKDYIQQRYEQFGLSAVRLHQEVEKMGYTGSLATLRRFIKTLKTNLKYKQKITVRFETPPGEQAQVDWGYCGRFDTPFGKKISVYMFVMILSFSRMLFVKFCTSMKLEELIFCHQAAFEYFGGWTKSILYDNMKQVKISRVKWNKQFLDFANHYGFIPKTHQPYRPRTKGKVERSVEYVKGNFMTGRKFEGLDNLNSRVSHWLEGTANQRVHGTTGQQPYELYKQEDLIPLKSAPVYNFLDPVTRQVNWESMIHFQGSRYSVPPKFAGKAVKVSACGGQIIVEAADMIIAEHKQALKAGQCIVDKEHISELWKITQEQIKPPEGTRWQINFDQSVQQMPLNRFEEVLIQ